MNNSFFFLMLVESLCFMFFQMSCSMDNSFMWQTVCEHWRVPKYCYTNMPELNFTAYLPKQRIKSVGDCAYFTLQKTKMSDGNKFFSYYKRKVKKLTQYYVL